ncbi:electron transport complex subunit RsxC [Candidatus Cryosericum hinesii]|jgi:electron transport complex protein RnfC|uniref:Ion-translocating oxidoreductase complex subunit C n=1 Tax=Candidatus Cryosericum hinesii TaxID=2290915 RepID=A0A398DDR7_9BACT|nr:electron transport complex subunit RsxC [Candidatus Cryosericum hinesii]RIE10326.1 electron transport complex subunit RsxC [Candidatus Cryosericum hinesii]RIE13305.1 electron transport complex subunit RsxC [Candidatus Cryosericum hinesii]RIE15703.1 electron transport complex subunit RsxC [Candidatus Cryosericum hinesii]
MSLKTFRGGIHPPEHKESTRDLPIERVPTPKSVVIHLTQAIGAQNQPLVKVGDRVVKGQMIGDVQACPAATVHASITGIVRKIEPAPQSNLKDGMAVFIEADGTDETAYMAPLDAFACSREEAIKRLRDAGIVGMGGASFPTDVKLAPPADKPIDTIIANGAECEPYLTIDYRTMMESPADVVEGLAIAAHIVGATRAIVAIESNKADALPVIEQQFAGHSHGIRMGTIIAATKYPEGGEKMLMKAITGREVPSKGLPFDIGVICQNVGTLKAIKEAFIDGKPLIERGFTVSGGACKTPKNLYAPIGTVIADLIPDVIQMSDDVRKVIFGGPMMGVTVPSLQTPIAKGTSGVLFFTAAESKQYEERLCIRCGRCANACPAQLMPMLMNAALDANDVNRADAIGLVDCFECGACSYVCPARIPLTQRFKLGKDLLRNQRAKEARHGK